MLRGFTDTTGVEWRVWEVFPTRNETPSSADTLSETSLRETPYANGWLCFESQIEKRRLAPIPIGWEFNDSGLLQQLCAQAQPVPTKKRRAPGAA